MLGPSLRMKKNESTPPGMQIPGHNRELRFPIYWYASMDWEIPDYVILFQILTLLKNRIQGTVHGTCTI